MDPEQWWISAVVRWFSVAHRRLVVPGEVVQVDPLDVVPPCRCYPDAVLDHQAR